jgi:uncharacterized membrane protein
MANDSGNGQQQSPWKSLFDELPLDRLKDEATKGVSALGQKAIDTAGDRITGATDQLNGIASGEGVKGKAAKKAAEEVAQGGSPVKGGLKGALGGAKDKIAEKLPGGGGGGGGGGKATKSTNIVEEIDIGAPLSVVYNQWTQFADFPDFMKKVEHAELEDDEEEATVEWKAQVFWSHRRWESTIEEMEPDQYITWRSQGDKGHVDGTVSFHELGPRLTRVLVVLEYYPQGFMERTGNIWRAQGRRARLELKHFRRHVMMNQMHAPEELEGWRGVIHDGEVVRSHEDVVEEEEEQQGGEAAEGEEAEGAYDEEDEQESGEEGEPSDEYEDEESAYAEEDEAPEDEYEEAEPEEEEEEPEEEYEEEYEEEPAEEYEEEPAPPRKRRARSR